MNIKALKCCLFGMVGLLLGASLHAEEVGATFLFRLNEIIRQVDPEQRLQDDLLEARLKELLGRAQSLRREHHLARQKGLREKEKLDRLEKEGRDLINEVLDMTQSYLEGRLESLKENRKALVEALLPKDEK